MVRKVKCSKCGREVVDTVKDKDGKDVCWNCIGSDEYDDVKIPEWIIFEATSIQKMTPKNAEVRYIIEIPKSLNFIINELGEHLRKSKWKIQIKSQAR